MHELLETIDLDYYRSARLLIVHDEIERLRQAGPASATRDGDLRALELERERLAALVAARRGAPLAK